MANIKLQDYFTAGGKIRKDILGKFNNSALVKKLETRTHADLNPVYKDPNASVEGNDVVGHKFFIKAPTIRMCFYKPEEIAVAHVLKSDMNLLDHILTAANQYKPTGSHCIETKQSKPRSFTTPFLFFSEFAETEATYGMTFHQYLKDRHLGLNAQIEEIIPCALSKGGKVKFKVTYYQEG